MHNYTRDDIFHIVEEEDVAFIRLQFTDIFGTMKNMAVTVGQLEKHWITAVCLMSLPWKGLQMRKNQICIYIRI